jgi:CheY-like chemotaxis protein
MTAPVPPAAGAPRLRVLVVDDEPTLLQIVVIVLGRFLAAECTAAACGAEALDRLKSAAYDALLTDVMMPGGMSGVQLVHEARRLQPDLACGLMTGYAVPEDRDAVPEGVFLVTKPFRIEELAAKVRSAIERQQRASVGAPSAPDA